LVPCVLISPPLVVRPDEIPHAHKCVSNFCAQQNRVQTVVGEHDSSDDPRRLTEQHGERPTSQANGRLHARGWSLFGTDTQRGVLTGLSHERNLRSKI
jgi:hypothetical protein